MRVTARYANVCPPTSQKSFKGSCVYSPNQPKSLSLRDSLSSLCRILHRQRAVRWIRAGRLCLIAKAFNNCDGVLNINNLMHCWSSLIKVSQATHRQLPLQEEIYEPDSAKVISRHKNLIAFKFELAHLRGALRAASNSEADSIEMKLAMKSKAFNNAGPDIQPKPFLCLTSKGMNSNMTHEIPIGQPMIAAGLHMLWYPDSLKFIEGLDSSAFRSERAVQPDFTAQHEKVFNDAQWGLSEAPVKRKISAANEKAAKLETLVFVCRAWRALATEGVRSAVSILPWRAGRASQVTGMLNKHLTGCQWAQGVIQLLPHSQTSMDQIFTIILLVFGERHYYCRSSNGEFYLYPCRLWWTSSKAWTAAWPSSQPSKATSTCRSQLRVSNWPQRFRIWP